MKIPNADRIAFAQGLYNDNPLDVLKYIRANSDAVDKIAMVSRNTLAHVTRHTFWFKGTNGEKDVRYICSVEEE